MFERIILVRIWSHPRRTRGFTAMSIKEIRNLDYTILLCGKMKETRAFYKDVMSFPVEIDLENRVSLFFRDPEDNPDTGNSGAGSSRDIA
jgi:hypothetical protein